MLARAAAVALAAAAAEAAADPILGTWAIPPDFKGQVGHIVIRPCGPAFCGRILRVLDRSGAEVVTRSMSRDLFRGLRAQGDGTYAGGTVWVPLFDVELPASARIDGNRLHVMACDGATCQGQVWMRLD